MGDDEGAAALNPAKARLDAGELVLCLGVRLARTVDIARMAKSAGFDALFIDMEHSAMALETAVQISVAALDVGITAVVRIPGHLPTEASRVLDGGALGVVVPHVDTPEQAKMMVDACKFPPLGHRSTGGPSVHLGFRPVPGAGDILNDATLVTVMLESPGAIANADAIAAVEGVDMIMIGTNDLSTEMGVPGQLGHDKIRAAYKTVGEACRKHGIHFAMGGVRGNPELISDYIGCGVRFILAASDSSLVLAGARREAEALRAIPLP